MYKSTFLACSQLEPARERPETVDLKFTFDMNIFGSNRCNLGGIEVNSHL